MGLSVESPILRRGKLVSNITCNETLYKQLNIKRWNSVETIKAQNLGEHHATVTQITLAIIGNIEEIGYDISDKTKFLAMAGASVHDLGEIAFGDMNYMLKAQNPDLSEISNRIEHDYIYRTLNYEKSFKEAQEDELARAIYKLADAMDMLLFVRREHSLGSKNEEMDAIATSTDSLIHQRLDTLFGLLEEHTKPFTFCEQSA